MKGEQFEVVNLDAGFGVQFSSQVVIGSLAKPKIVYPDFPSQTNELRKYEKNNHHDEEEIL